MKLKTALTAVSVAAMVWGGGAAQLQSAPHPDPLLSGANSKQMETDSRGDWYSPYGSDYEPYWRVVDPDPNGLNCRRQGTVDSIVQRRREFTNFLEMPVVTTLEYGTQFYIGERPLTIDDYRREPWIYNRTHGCFVRFNSAFIEPVY